MYAEDIFHEQLKSSILELKMEENWFQKLFTKYKETV